MKKTLLSLIALGVFATSFAGTFAYHATQEEKIWVYTDGSGDQTDNPQCLGDAPVCAEEFVVNPEDWSLTPTGNERHGMRIN